MALHRINTGEDVVNGMVVCCPRDNGYVDKTDGVRTAGFTPRAQHIPSGATITQWNTLNTRYLVAPSGWNS